MFGGDDQPPVIDGPMASISSQTLGSIEDLGKPAPGTTHQTARTALRMLLASDPAYRAPDRTQQLALQVGFAMRGKTIYGTGYDAIRLSREVDLLDPQAIAASLDAITIYEIKSTNRAAMKADLRGYFFNITAAELLVAQSLGAQYRFLFINTVSGERQEMAMSEVFARARKIYPAWHLVL